MKRASAQANHDKSDVVEVPNNQDKESNEASEDSADQRVDQANDEYPYMLEDFGVLQFQEYVDIAKVVNASNPRQNMQLFTVDQSDPKNIRLTVYKIKRVFQSAHQIIKDKLRKKQEQEDKLGNKRMTLIDQAFFQQKFRQLLQRQTTMNKSTYKLQSFKISKYSTVKLDFRPNQIEFQDPFFILTYINDT